MILKNFSTCIILVVTISFVLCLSSCTSTSKTESDGNYQGKEYLENMGNGICRQYPSGLMWQSEKSPNFSSWEDANQYVNSLNLGGFEDWRLPTSDECLNLSQLIQRKMSDCPMETGGNHWVSKTENVEAGKWENNILCDGSIMQWTKSKKGRVHAVRP
jgi:hypothetical protein